MIRSVRRFDFSELNPQGTTGYDGQFAYYIARDGFAAAPNLDNPSWRFQRIIYPALARALMSSPELIMLDEPSLGLAPKLVKEVFDIITAIHQQGKTVLLVEQNAYASLKIADYAYVLEVGSVVLEGTGEALISDPRVREAYLGG